MWRERWTVAGLHRGPGSAEQPPMDNQTTVRVEKSQPWDFAGGPGAKTLCKDISVYNGKNVNNLNVHQCGNHDTKVQ